MPDNEIPNGIPMYDFDSPAFVARAARYDSSRVRAYVTDIRASSNPTEAQVKFIQQYCYFTREFG